jgi:hypothetical protein
MAKRTGKPRVKKIVLAPGEAASVAIPKNYTPLVAADPDKGGVVHVVPVKKKKRGWWETLLYGDDD